LGGTAGAKLQGERLPLDLGDTEAEPGLDQAIQARRLRAMTRQERILALVLRVGAVPLLLALPCAGLPPAWMDVTHRWLGLGPLPTGPIVDYLARSCSLFYALHGAMILFVSFDVRRYLPFIRFLGWLGIALGFGMLAVDHVAQLPGYWRWLEGPFVIAEGLLVLWLARRARRLADDG
jgi:hypothetical protein